MKMQRINIYDGDIARGTAPELNVRKGQSHGRDVVSFPKWFNTNAGATTYISCSFITFETDTGDLYYLVWPYSPDAEIRAHWDELKDEVVIDYHHSVKHIALYCSDRVTLLKTFVTGTRVGQKPAVRIWNTSCPGDDTAEPPSSLPWDNYDGGIFHIKNVQNNKINLPGEFKAWDVDGTNERLITEVAIGEELVFVTDDSNANGLFESNRDGTSWEFGDITNTSKVTNMSGMFRSSSFNADISSWDTSNVTSMKEMFMDSVFNQNISSWDTGNVTNMKEMFAHSRFNQNISGWNTSNVTNMEGVFAWDASFNIDISGWNTSNVTNMANMFQRTPFNQNISGWDTSNVTDMEEMFIGAEDFNQDISEWCVTNIASMPDNFDEDSGFEGQTAKQPQWGTCPRGEDGA